MSYTLHYSTTDSRLNLQPRPYHVSTPGSKVIFICRSVPHAGDEFVSLHWLVNGTTLEDLNLHNVTAEIGDGYGILVFVDIPTEYNSTRIACVATINLEMTQINDTRDSLLIVQGKFLCVSV